MLSKNTPYIHQMLLVKSRPNTSYCNGENVQSRSQQQFERKTVGKKKMDSTGHRQSRHFSFPVGKPVIRVRRDNTPTCHIRLFVFSPLYHQ